MKILKTSIVMFLALFIVVGCGGTKKMTCTMETTQDEQGSYDQTVVGTFKKDVISRIGWNIRYTMTELELANTLMSEMSALKEDLEELGFEVQAKQNKNIITIDFEGDVDKVVEKLADNEDYSDTFDFDKDETLAEFKEEMEADGYTCK